MGTHLVGCRFCSQPRFLYLKKLRVRGWLEVLGAIAACAQEQVLGPRVLSGSLLPALVGPGCPPEQEAESSEFFQDKAEGSFSQGVTRGDENKA